MRNNSSFQKLHQKAGLRREKKSLASIYEILLEIEEHSFDIDRIKGVEKSWIGGGGEAENPGATTPPRNEKEARQGFYFISVIGKP